MSYLFGLFFAQHDCYYVKAKGPVLDIICGKKIACRFEHPGLFGFCYNRLGRAEVFVRPGLDFNKYKCPVAIDHNQVDFTGLAGKVSGERFETFAFEKFLAAFFTPSAE
jgi:hypothetical protein